MRKFLSRTYYDYRDPQDDTVNLIIYIPRVQQTSVRKDLINIRVEQAYTARPRTTS